MVRQARPYKEVCSGVLSEDDALFGRVLALALGAEQARSDLKHSQQRQKNAGIALRNAIDDACVAVATLDSLVQPQLRGDPVRLAAWMSACRGFSLKTPSRKTAERRSKKALPQPANRPRLPRTATARIVEEPREPKALTVPADGLKLLPSQTTAEVPLKR